VHSKTTPWRRVLLGTLGAGCFSAGSIWLAQLNWQLLRHVGPDQFPDYFAAWQDGLYWASAPVAVAALAGAFAQLRWRPPGVARRAVWLGVALQGVIWTLTLLWWAPAEDRLHQVRSPDGSLDPLYQQLVAANWLRVALVTAFGMLQLWMAARVLRTHQHDDAARVGSTAHAA
jgi:hypothetical protein